MGSTSKELLRAIDLAVAGDWDYAHSLAQEYEGEAIADWIHAVLHKIEGDSANSRYWYDRAGKPEWFAGDPEAEWTAIRDCLADGNTGS